MCLRISSCCLHTAKVTASLQAQDWSLYGRGFDELQWDLEGAVPMEFAQICPFLLPSSHEHRVCSCATDVFPSTEEPTQGRPSLELKGSLFSTKYTFYIDIFVQRLNLACVEFSQSQNHLSKLGLAETTFKCYKCHHLNH